MKCNTMELGKANKWKEKRTREGIRNRDPLVRTLRFPIKTPNWKYTKSNAGKKRSYLPYTSKSQSIPEGSVRAGTQLGA